MAVSVAAVLELAPKSPTAPKLNETESADAGAAGQKRGEARPSSRAQTAGTSLFLTGASSARGSVRPDPGCVVGGLWGDFAGSRRGSFRNRPVGRKRAQWRNRRERCRSNRGKTGQKGTPSPSQGTPESVREAVPSPCDPMLATSGQLPPDDGRWAYEPK